ncbi:HAD family phosphatase [Rhizobacter sp. Root1221]|uniref:histidinol-phosphatase n=1 Tax=Rhizobacter sp. Root1221 TaxID=1736433 RepID=UPI0006FEB453|nr:HAD family phosphatase [Rhizobacter sp. Root1221]KQV78766.1 phosphoserine phosphatase [Rhizobacter sp. Root1221]
MTKNLCLFDLDHTLLPIDSDHTWGEFMIRQGWVDVDSFRAGNNAFYAKYQAGTLDIHEYIEFTTRPWRDRPAAELAAAHDQFMSEDILPAMRPAAVDLVRHHQAQGDLVALVTATNEFVTAPIAKAFGVDHLLAVRLERDGAGQVTGRVDGTPSFREGKVTRTAEWLAEMGLSFTSFGCIHMYSDSANDLPLMEQATHPVATNPAPSLETIARERGWRILQLFT